MGKVFSEKLNFPAELDVLQRVFDFVSGILEAHGFSAEENISVQIAVEEIFSNIANYAYGSGKGDVLVQVEIEDDPKKAVIIFVDSGVPYNPLEKEDPDISLSSDERTIGGLGIFMVKESMDDVAYQYVDGNNILTITKKSATSG